MRDGVLMATEVYLPATPSGGGRYPVLMQRSPYNRNGAAVDVSCSNAQMQFFARNGYAALNQDVRGMYRSAGVFNPMQQEANDGYDAVEWAAARTWSNGKVGLFGGSYVGLTQWQPAKESPPSLVAIAPNVTASDYHDHWTYIDGTFDLWFAQSWILLTFGPETYLRNLLAAGLPRDQANQQVASWVAAGRSNILSTWVWELPLKSFPEYRELAPYYYTWLRHPTYDRFWANLDVEPHYGDVVVPSLNTGGWYDIFQIGTVRNFLGMRAKGGSRDARQGSQLIMRASCHACPATTFAGAIDFGPNNQYDANAVMLRWFDYWLKGIQNGVDRDPAVQLFVMVPPDTGTTASGFWVYGDTFPLAGTKNEKLYLRSDSGANAASGDGGLVADAPDHGKKGGKNRGTKPDEFVYDPRDPVPTVGGNMCCINDIVASGAFDQTVVESRDDVLVYTSAPLEKDLAVIGSVSVKLWAASSAPDTDFTAKLVDVHLDGFAHNVLNRVVRARYREGSKSAPKLITPGNTYEYTIELGNTATVFRKGHRIRLEVSSSNFPHYDRNPNTGHAFAQDAVLRKAYQTIYHDAKRPSHLVLPIAAGVKVP